MSESVNQPNIELDSQQYQSTKGDRKPYDSPLNNIMGWLEGVRTRRQGNESIRAFDNKCGLVVGDGGGPAFLNGAGTRFRTAEFMTVPMEQRSGRKANANKWYGVHVEHAIPVSLRQDMLEALYSNGVITCPVSLCKWLLRFQYAVGMTRDEERTSIPKKYRYKHPDWKGGDDLEALTSDSIRPFARYTDNVRIFDMETGLEVSLQATIATIDGLADEAESSLKPS